MSSFDNEEKDMASEVKDGITVTQKDIDEAKRIIEGKSPDEIATILAKARKGEEVYEELAKTDFLTGILNRRGVIEEFRRVVEVIESSPGTKRTEGKRLNIPFSVIMLDLVGFHQIDFEDPLNADKLLKRVANLLGENIARRGTDVVGRWGGDEFAVLSAEADQNSAVEMANKIQDGLGLYGLKASIAIGLYDNNINRLEQNLDSVYYGLSLAKLAKDTDETGRTLGTGIVITNNDQLLE